MFKLTLVTLLSLEVAQARLTLGECETPTLQKNFDPQAYLGLWYELFREEETRFQKGGECATAEYSLNDDGSIKVVNGMYLPEKKKI